MAAIYHQSPVPSFHPTLYGPYTVSGSGYKINSIKVKPVDSEDQLSSSSPDLQVSESNQPAATAKSNKTKRDADTKTASFDGSRGKDCTFTCEECGKSVRSRHYLKIHMRIHSGEKPYQCSHCSLSFSIQGNMRKHMRTHLGVKNYACTYCGQMFRDSSSRSRHERLHTGEMPYHCQECDQSFRYREMYKTHMMTVHGLDENNVTPLPPAKRNRSERGSVEGSLTLQGLSYLQKLNIDFMPQEQKCEGTPVNMLNVSEMVRSYTGVSIAKNKDNIAAAVDESISSVTVISSQSNANTNCDSVQESSSEMKSLNSENDLTFESTSPDKLMPQELQNNEQFPASDDALSHTGSKSSVTIHKHGSPMKAQLRRFHCSKCTKTFLNKSQLTRHQKMHRLLTMGTGRPQILRSVSSDRIVRHGSAKDKPRTQNLRFVEQANTKESDIPLDLTSVKRSYNSVTGTVDSSDQRIHSTFPKTFHQDYSFHGKVSREEGKETVELSYQPQVTSHESNRACFDTSTASETKENANDIKRNPSADVGSDGVECNVCGRILCRGVYMKAHMRIHSGEKPHVCKFCGRGFTVSQNLYKHMRIHTGEKNYACPTCGRKFNTSTSRNRHMARHKGDKPYPCQVCSEQFQYLDGLKNHCQKFHPQIDLTAGQVSWRSAKTKAFEKDFLPVLGPRHDSVNIASSDHIISAQDFAKSILESIKKKSRQYSSNLLNQSQSQQSTSCGQPAVSTLNDSDRLMFPYDPPSDVSRLEGTDEINTSTNNHLRMSHTECHMSTVEQEALLTTDFNKAAGKELTETVPEEANNTPSSKPLQSHVPGPTHVTDSQTQSKEVAPLKPDECSQQDQSQTGLTKVLNLVQTAAVSSKNMAMKVNALPRYGISHRKQAAPMKLSTIPYAEEEAKHCLGSLVSAADSVSTLPESFVRSGSSGVIRKEPNWCAQDDVEEDSFIRVNKQNKSGDSEDRVDVNNDYKCSECQMILEDKESLFTHSQRHKLENAQDSTVRSEVLKQSPHSKPPTDDLTPVSEIMKTCNSTSLPPRTSDSWSESVLSAVDSFCSVYPEAQHYQNRLTASLASGVQPSKCSVCFAVFSSTRKFNLHIADHCRNVPLVEDTQQDTEIIQPSSQSCNDNKSSQTAHSSSQKDGPVSSVCVKSSVDTHHHTPSVDFNDKAFSKCDASFPTLGLIKTHETTHLPFCQVYGKMCSTVKELEEHSITHDMDVNEDTNIRSVKDADFEDSCMKCRHCSGSFISYRDLRDHLKVHEGQPVFNCPLCVGVFTHQDQLMNHLKHHIYA